MTPLVAFIFALAFMAIIAWLYSVQSVLRRLQHAHPDLYEDMGRPHIVSNNTPENNGPVLSFVLGRKYRELGDPILEKLGDRARIVFFVASIMIGAMFIAFFVNLATTARR
jgi:hypothetical protein